MTSDQASSFNRLANPGEMILMMFGTKDVVLVA
jgi:hypothetical protein